MSSGPYERELRIGFASRAIETAELADVEIYVEIEGKDNETGKTCSNIGFIEELVTKSKTKKARKAAVGGWGTPPLGRTCPQISAFAVL